MRYRYNMMVGWFGMMILSIIIIGIVIVSSSRQSPNNDLEIIL